jgi:ribosomal protein S18 acetylase RimI-like enzyme
VIEVDALPGDAETTTWEVRRNGRALGTATTGMRRSGPLLTALDVPQEAAAETLDALLRAVRDRGEESLAIDVPTGDPVLESALQGRDARLVATQMRLDLSRPPSPPDRVALRAMTRDEFAAYREHLVTSYAQDMFDAGAFADLPTALTASEQSTRELLPEGPDSPGHHLWTATDGATEVGILWIHAEGASAFIYDIEVRDEHRRRGYGREILDAGAVAARALGADALGLNVFGHNEGARALYERAGYDTTERTFRITD